MALYVTLGLIGLPIFALGGGVSYIFQPTFGYLIGFVVAAAASGAVVGKGLPTVKRLFMAFGLALLSVYVIGLAYAALIVTVYLKEPILLTEFLIGYALLTLPKDVILTILCVPLSCRLLPKLPFSYRTAKKQ